MFWLIVAIVVSLSVGFVMGATFRQYRKPVKQVEVKSPYEFKIQYPQTINYGDSSNNDEWTWTTIDFHSWTRKG